MTWYKNKTLQVFIIIFLHMSILDFFHVGSKGAVFFVEESLRLHTILIHLGVALESDKRNLGLLRELAEQNKLSSEDKALVLETIPWTCAIEDRQVTYDGEEHNLIELLKKNKDHFVIKAAVGYQGTNVFVGKFLSDDSWENAIEFGIKEKKFIAQEFSDSLNFMAPNAQSKWSEHKLIWGSFGFGEEYGGVWVRMSANQNDGGVINCATGAMVAIVYETI